MTRLLRATANLQNFTLINLIFCLNSCKKTADFFVSSFCVINCKTLYSQMEIDKIELMLIKVSGGKGIDEIKRFRIVIKDSEILQLQEKFQQKKKSRITRFQLIHKLCQILQTLSQKVIVLGMRRSENLYLVLLLVRTL